jgi:hypothetical protein
MSRNSTLEAGLKRIADDYHLPGGGRKKLSQLVAEHLDWFDAAEKRGMGWRDIIRVLTAAGLAGKQGKPLSIGTLSSAVWRKRVELKADDKAESLHTPRSHPPRPMPPLPDKRPKHGLPRQDVVLRKGVLDRKPAQESQASARIGRAASFGQLVSTKPLPSTPKAGTHSNRDLLDFMNRARKARLRSDDQ